MTTVCLTCGNVNDDSARFCSSCGASISGTSDTSVISLVADSDTSEISLADIEALGALPAGSAFLVVRRGALEGVRFPLDVRKAEPITVGRSPESGVFLDDVTVSRKHASLEYNGTTWMISDAGSLNGTYVNRNRVDSIALNENDEVQIGKYRFVYLSAASGE